MWKALWKKWTLDKPAAFGDLLWEVFVVQFAAFLDRFTLRKVIAFTIPIVFLAIAYHHGIALPPEVVLVGDFIAYVDVFTVVLLLGLLSRATTILYVLRQAASRLASLANSFNSVARRLDVRHRRERISKRHKPPSRQAGNDDGEGFVIGGLVWA
jgi:hypothetical protein